MIDKTMIRDLPAAERPYERCREFGPEALSDTELLAVLLRTGAQDCSALELAGRVLRKCPTDTGLTGVMRLSTAELEQIPGIGPVKAVQIRCMGELSRRISRRRGNLRPVFREPEGIAEYYMENLRYCEQEHVFCMMLDTRNGLLGETEISRGTVNQALLSPRELFLKALAYRAVHIVLVHNHPSGDPSPSTEDIRITQMTAEAGILLGIPLLDHIIVGDRTYHSLRRSHEELFCPEHTKRDGIV